MQGGNEMVISTVLNIDRFRSLFRTFYSVLVIPNTLCDLLQQWGTSIKRKRYCPNNCASFHFPPILILILFSHLPFLFSLLVFVLVDIFILTFHFLFSFSIFIFFFHSQFSFSFSFSFFIFSLQDFLRSQIFLQVQVQITVAEMK